MTDETRPQQENRPESDIAQEQAPIASSAEASTADGETAPSADTASSVGSNADAKPERQKKPRSRTFKIMRVLVIIAVVLVVAGAVTMAVAKSFTAAEQQVRSDWSTQTGELLGSDEELGLEVHAADLGSELRVAQLVPAEIDEEGFTYYDTGVQDRIAQLIGDIKNKRAWEASNPLAILNPFGTGSNGLYLYFATDLDTKVTYTIEADGTTSFTRTAQNVFLDEQAQEKSGGREYAKQHEFQIVGLVPGKVNHVTLAVTGEFGVQRQTVTFSLSMPDAESGYATKLASVDGESDAAPSPGLYALVRVNGHLGYTYFFDDDGVLRYEMETEGYGLDRILSYGGDLLVCSASDAIARVDGLGRVKRVYELGAYDMHHDLQMSGDTTLVVLAEHDDAVTVEDVVLELDLETGEVVELLDFTDFMADYVDKYTHVIGPTDTFFWQAGENDWIHLNTIQYLQDDDAIIVSSRETSTIMKVRDVHEEPAIDWFAGDAGFWKGTPYEDFCLEQEGDFSPQYGQHSVEYDGEGPTEDSYYLLMFDNNYWANSTRAGYAPELSDEVSTDMYGTVGDKSHAYRYLVDENARTFTLVESFDVPYSSIVSNVQRLDDGSADDGEYVVNSGISKVFGEYDADGQLIRQFAYECQMQTYRAFKHDFIGFWFAE